MIPLKLETLLEGQVVEHDRVEYKKGWNPNDAIHTICAYANDFNNTNGGYVVIGVEEKRGRPVLPPFGVDANDLDKVQQEIFQYCNQIEPRYIPRIEIEKKDGMNVIYLWCPAGDSGPYTAPNDVLVKDKKQKHWNYWIKPASVKTIAKGDEISELYEKFNSVPFDDRVNRNATVDDISYGYLGEFISQSHSALLEVKKNMQKEDLLLSLEVANETDAGIDIRNIGILMFCERPDKFIPGAMIEIVHFRTRDREAGDFTEMTFQGPIQEQVRKTLGYIAAIAVMEKVVKHDDRPEASRFFTYPLAAIEEALVNSIFHKSYRIPEPVSVRIYIDEIQIHNLPGPDKSMDMKLFAQGKAIPHRYRNRRIGEFLKEIDLSEKQSTGITKILKALAANGSPLPKFETNDNRDYLITTFKVHEGFDQSELPGISMFLGKIGGIGTDGTDGGANGTDADTDGTDYGTAGTDYGTDGTDYGTDGTDYGTAGTDYGTDGTDGGANGTDDGTNDGTDGGTDGTDGGTDGTDAGADGTDAGADGTDAGADGTDSTDDGIDGTNDGTDGGTDGTNDGTDDDIKVTLIKSDRKVLAAIKENPTASIDELVKGTSVSRRTVLRSVAKLKTSGILVRTGGTRTGYWEIKH